MMRNPFNHEQLNAIMTFFFIKFISLLVNFMNYFSLIFIDLAIFLHPLPLDNKATSLINKINCYI